MSGPCDWCGARVRSLCRALIFLAVGQILLAGAFVFHVLNGR
jgi:hypothetical protein